MSSPLAFSYIRFSSPEQAKGDSLRRQNKNVTDWLERNPDVRLDTSMTLQDKGISGYTGEHRKNPDRHALAAFLRAIELQRVPRGSYLLIENLDRLSREHIQPALLLVLDLLQKGIRIVQLSPVEMVFTDKSDAMPVMMMIMELSRGNGESKIKSERVGAAWGEKKKEAREKGTVVTKRLPAWVSLKAGKLVLNDKAEAVREVFRLSSAGYGHAAIVSKLTTSKVPAIGDSGKWVKSYVAKVLADRRAVGEYQPCNRDGSKDGPAIPNYFPAVVTEDVFSKCRGGAKQRRNKAGRVGKNLNIFAGLVVNAYEGDAYFLCTRTESRRGEKKTHQVLLNANSAEGRSPAMSFPFGQFEEAVLLSLREVDPAEVVGAGDCSGDAVMVLSGQLAGVESSIAALEADLEEHGDSPLLFKRLRAKEVERGELVRQLADARQKAAHPLAEAWGEAHSLVDVLRKAGDPDEARVRLRSALRRIVSVIRLLVMPMGRNRLAMVQMDFVGGGRRWYLIEHSPPHAGFGGHKQPPKLTVVGWRPEELEGLMGDVDLADAATVERLAVQIPSRWDRVKATLLEIAAS